ncbi:PEPxxWA-CTERM sorting domain-containing protein [Pseudokordiimonas caeni]|uniref:PEPxxWA-CTERM sorting domain-containing protein n=1 Tax=Pseudokordiimonas caeni TaxID=2997908 RepID=UPI0028123078|nr:PEPxxWA-CTERM sorting domain-containing protein [Pseudokordiimonas caeni]
MKKFIVGAFAAAMLSVSAQAATTMEFVPPSDTVGMIYSTNSNDGYANGRGVVFEMASDFELFSVGLFQDLTGVDLSWELTLAPVGTGYVGGGSVVQSGGGNVTTSGLEWVEFNFSPLTLLAGNIYHLNFVFNDSSNQNFFYSQYNDGNTQAYDDGIFLNIDGTQEAETSNYVLPGIRLNGGIASGIPEPATWLMMIMGFGLVGIASRRRTGALAL